MQSIIPLRHQLSSTYALIVSNIPTLISIFKSVRAWITLRVNDIDIALRFGPQPHSDWVAS
ncbi:hypothetical protein ACT691_08850 [Vibrio metschnikovii]